MRRIAAILILVIAGHTLAQQPQGSIVNSKHNLSASGSGSIRAASEQQLCIFCHTPHNASPIQPLWNRSQPVSAYTVYSSSSLQAKPGQPTGSSKLCLSCHDGTIAVGSVLSRAQPIPMAGGITTLPPGHSNLGTDLSDDHPISFRYDASLVAQDPKLKPPSALPQPVKLDPNQEVQCTSCHDAHNNTFGKFLVMENSSAQLCSACHQAGDTTIAAHQDCATCHQMHTAPSGAMLLRGANSSQTCLTCHSSLPGQQRQGTNIAGDLAKISRHDAPAAAPMMPASEVALLQQGTVGCGDCHEPHSMQSATAEPPLLSPKLGKISGVDASGGQKLAAQFQFEVCYKCHGNTATGTAKVTRQVAQTNTRLEFAPSAVSFHPVQAAGRSADVPSLRTGLTTASLIYCTDCHSSDTSKTAGGTGPNGPHGSNSSPLLVARYETLDNTPESATAYALCYRCHDRTSLLNDESFSSHKRHIVDFNTPCSVCHDAHGISSAQGTTTNNAHLINFDTTIVGPDPVTGKLEYRSLGMRTGECTLSCHGAPHSPLSYPGGAVAPGVPGAEPEGIRLFRARPRSPATPPAPPTRRPSPRTSKTTR